MRLRALGVVALVCLAGCSGLFGDPVGTDRETLTPAPLPTETSETETRALPPGVGGGGDLHLDELVAAHQEALTDRSYVWRERRGTTRANASAVEPRPVQAARVAAEDCYRFWAESYTVDLGMETRVAYNYTEYVDEGVGHVRLETFRTDTWEYYRLPAPRAGQRVGTATGAAIERYLRLSPENVTVSVGRADGERRYLVAGDGGVPRGIDGARNYSVAAVVDSEGLVRSLSARYRTVGFATPRVVRYEFTLERFGNVTVGSPAWYDMTC
ncbi:hypothetical protein C475_21824 [Halosimplex carlsbadense 2-9-1]|uniref:Uncharacterized protein n=1 Tax=Halosimplex carlsbadense 2-9-1 TaxID=797114 RepID=M0C9M6_9EURY|nr:hypothetical protein [Halosimplex carlsbadense]ELZ19981.1 hypothetical protein C475_21824 [Halosimplex carlsbadense 2-9-1]